MFSVKISFISWYQEKGKHIFCFMWCSLATILTFQRCSRAPVSFCLQNNVLDTCMSSDKTVISLYLFQENYKKLSHRKIWSFGWSINLHQNPCLSSKTIASSICYVDIVLTEKKNRNFYIKLFNKETSFTILGVVQCSKEPVDELIVKLYTLVKTQDPENHTLFSGTYLSRPG